MRPDDFEVTQKGPSRLEVTGSFPTRHFKHALAEKRSTGVTATDIVEMLGRQTGYIITASPPSCEGGLLTLVRIAVKGDPFTAQEILLAFVNAMLRQIGAGTAGQIVLKEDEEALGDPRLFDPASGRVVVCPNCDSQTLHRAMGHPHVASWSCETCGWRADW